MVLVGWQCVVSLIIQGTLSSKHPYICPDYLNYVYILNIWSLYVFLYWWSVYNWGWWEYCYAIKQSQFQNKYGHHTFSLMFPHSLSWSVSLYIEHILCSNWTCKWLLGQMIILEIHHCSNWTKRLSGHWDIFFLKRRQKICLIN